MDRFHKLAQDELAVAAGFKTVAIAVILGTFLALAEQAPYASHAYEGPVIAMPGDPRADPPPIAPPAGLRARAGEVPPQIEAF